MGGHEVFDGADVLGQVLDRHRDVLDDRDGLVVAANAHQETESGFADRPDILLLLGIEHDERIAHQANASLGQVGDQAVGFALQLVF